MNKNKIIEFLKNKAGGPLPVPKIARGMGLPKTAQKSLKRQLKQLQSEGLVICIKGTRFGVAEQMEMLVGHVQVHPGGFGFLLTEKPGEADVFIKSRNLREVQDGDKVVVRIDSTKKGGKREGSVVRVLERVRKQIVGRYEKQGRFAHVVPIDPKLTRDVTIPFAKDKKVKPGQLVVAQIVRYPSRNRSAEGKIIEILGDKDTPGIETEAIIRSCQLAVEFPADVLTEAAGFPEEVEDIDPRRRDLRDMTIFTIDGETAKDFDDAISLYPGKDGGWRLGVHIADVSHYVSEGSALDKEAEQRGCSVYFIDRVLPMLPEKLSNGLCSLRPEVDRLAFSLFMDINPEGEIVNYEFADSVINSCARLTYTGVRSMLEDKDPQLCREYAGILPTLREMYKVAFLLKEKRLLKGGLDFDLPEPEIILDLQGRPQDIIKRERNLAHELIENFMLAANQTVAAHVAKTQLPFIYRIHEKPDPEKLSELVEFVKNFGYTLEISHDIKPTDLQQLLPQIKDKPEETVITINMLRSLKLARYATQNVGHFGLGMSFYTHFTSPIRRYPDLIVHRLLRKYSGHRGRLSDSQKETHTESLNIIAQESSARERIAEKAEREIIKIKRVQFMESKLGEKFVGIVCGVSNFGLFVELQEIFVEGLVHVSNLRDDYYHFVEEEHVLVGENSGKKYKIGDKLLLLVERVDVDRRQVDFNVVEILPKD